MVLCWMGPFQTDEHFEFWEMKWNFQLAYFYSTGNIATLIRVFLKLYKIGKVANKDLQVKGQNKFSKNSPVGIEPRTSCDLVWCLSNCTILAIGCQSEVLRALELCCIDSRNGVSPKYELVQETKFVLDISLQHMSG